MKIEGNTEKALELMLEASKLMGWNVLINTTNNPEHLVEFITIISPENKEVELALEDGGVTFTVLQKRDQ